MAAGIFFRPDIGQVGAVDEEDVGPAVAIVIEDGDSGAGGLDDVALGIDTSVDVADGDTSFRGDVNEPCRGCMIGGGGIRLLRGDRGKKQVECALQEQPEDCAGHGYSLPVTGGVPMATVLRIFPPS